MKLACVIHRFGADIAGGSEGHCRLIAEHLAARHDVTVITTCAARSHHVGQPLSAGRVAASARCACCGSRSRASGRCTDSWTSATWSSPTARRRRSRSSGSGRTVRTRRTCWRTSGATAPEFDRVLFWSYRYYDAYFGLPLVADRAVLVPTAEEDPLIHVDVLDEFFRLPQGFLFLTPEEEALVAMRAPAGKPSAVIGCGLDPAAGAADLSPLDGLGLADPFVLYLGRIDPNKGCRALVRHFLRYAELGKTVPLVMAGPASMPIPEHPLIRPLGFVDDAVREALLTRARALVMPSPFESLSMVLLEAWNHGLPALVNARCKVLRGQVERADGGLYYANTTEFIAALDYLLEHPDAARTLGRQGLAYVDREYRWPIVMDKIERLLAQTA